MFFLYSITQSWMDFNFPGAITETKLYPPNPRKKKKKNFAKITLVLSNAGLEYAKSNPRLLPQS